MTVSSNAIAGCLRSWSGTCCPPRAAHLPGPHPHPESASIKAFLVKLCEGKDRVTQLRSYLVEHPRLLLELGFTPVLDPLAPYGFDVERSVPGDRWLRHKQQTLCFDHLRQLPGCTVEALCDEIPGLGETVAIDVKHIYAWVKENNPREYLTTLLINARALQPARQINRSLLAWE